MPQRDLPDVFSLNDVREQMRTKDLASATSIKRASLSTALKRLADEGVIQVVEAGSGKRASRYRVMKQADAASSEPVAEDHQDVPF